MTESPPNGADGTYVGRRIPIAGPVAPTFWIVGFAPEPDRRDDFRPTHDLDVRDGGHLQQVENLAHMDSRRPGRVHDLGSRGLHERTAVAWATGRTEKAAVCLFGR